MTLKRTIKALVFLIVLLGTGLAPVSQSVKPQLALAANAQISKEERERLLAIGKKIFVERCSSCHNERGDKPLSSGPPLNERKLTSDEVAKSAGSRLKEATEEERRAVTLYICSFIKKK